MARLEEIPKCEHCGKKREFECQIMPQILYYLKVDDGVSLDLAALPATSVTDVPVQVLEFVNFVCDTVDLSVVMIMDKILDFLRISTYYRTSLGGHSIYLLAPGVVN